VSQKPRVPSYRQHRQSGQAIVTLTGRRPASRCSCHRVIVQQKLMELLHGGVRRRKEKDWVIVWDVLAVLTINPHDGGLMA
jgi:hypothetical protein